MRTKPTTDEKIGLIYWVVIIVAVGYLLTRHLWSVAL